jgi:hypothetical protein
MRKRLTCVSAAGILLFITVAPAQAGQSSAAAASPPDFSALNIKTADPVRLSDLGNGTRISGRVSRVTPTETWGDRYRFRANNRLKIKRRGDPIWEGAAIGFGLGSLVLFPLIPETFVPHGGRFRINNGLFWGAIGALIDHAHR